jgi:hypothetical protein
MDAGFFRHLSESQVKEFKQWTRDNYTPGDEISDLWHPVIKEECRKINRGEK